MIETLAAKVTLYRSQFSEIFPNMTKSYIKNCPEKPVFNCNQSPINGLDRLYGKVKMIYNFIQQSIQSNWRTLRINM